MPTALWYGLTVSNQFGGTSTDKVNWTADTLKVALVTNAYTPNQDTHDYWNDVSANELATGNGYTTGGYTLLSPTRTYDTASNTVRLDAADPTWTFSATKVFQYGVLYKDTGAAATSPVLAYCDLGAVSVSGVYTVQFDATDGALRAVVS